MSEVTAEMIERGRGLDPRTAAQRRQLNARVKETRAKLTSDGTGNPIFDHELLRLYAESISGASATMALLATAIGGMALFWLPLRPVLIWMTLVSTGLTLSHSLATRFLKTPEAQVSARRWRRLFALASTLQGVLWAAIVVLLLDQADATARTFVLFVLLLIAALTAMVAATNLLAVIGGLTPVMIAIAIFMSPASDLQTLPIMLAASGALLYFVLLARRLYSTALATLSLSMEKEALIAELEQAKANSDEARRRAEEANLAKSRFLATMSHELRTPLNAILGFSEVLKSELFGPHQVPAYKEYSNDIHSSGQHLLMLINEILDLSRVEAGRYELREESVSLANVVEDCRHLLSLRAKNRSLVVNETIEPNLPRLWVDERAMRQVTLNLLTNAIKFTPQGGTITIKVGWTAQGGQYISIRDTGPGIPAEEIPVIMSSFGRGSLAQKNADEGSGLGLPIVKGLIELHGGTFTIKSEVRVGTEVIVVMPPERVMDALPQLDPERPPIEEKRRRSGLRITRSAA
jgi:two-component system cell cycle sensor histidine kinase PleC